MILFLNDCPIAGLHRHEQGDGGGEGWRGDGEPLQRGHHRSGEDPLRQGHLQGGVQLVAGGPPDLPQVRLQLVGGLEQGKLSAFLKLKDRTCTRLKRGRATCCRPFFLLIYFYFYYCNKIKLSFQVCKCITYKMYEPHNVTQFSWQTVLCWIIYIIWLLQ